MAKTDSQRLVDLKAALKTSKKGSLSTLEDFAALWGVTKPRFVNKVKEFAAWPEYVEKNGNAYMFDRRANIRAMIDHIDRHKQEQGSRAKKLAAMIGTDQMAEHMAGGFSIAELAHANKLAADLEARAREQGLYAPIAEIQRVVGMVFSEISEFVSNLSNKIDPHGKLPASTRALIDSACHEQLMSVHAQLKGMLSPDAIERPTRKPDRKPRQLRPARKRSRSGPRKAR